MTSSARIRYRILDVVFHVLHVVVIGFTGFGWMIPQWRSAHLAFVAATLLSWYLVGIWLGMGYCPITDWHWRIKSAYGPGRPAGSYFGFWAARFGAPGHWLPWVDRLVAAVTVALLVWSAYLRFST